MECIGRDCFMLGKPVPRSLSPFFGVPMNRFFVFVFAFAPHLPFHTEGSWGSPNIHIRGCNCLVGKDRNGRIPGRIPDLFVSALED